MNLKLPLILMAIATAGTLLGLAIDNGGRPAREDVDSNIQITSEALRAQRVAATGDTSITTTTGIKGENIRQQVEAAFAGTRVGAAAPDGMSPVVWDRALTAYGCAMRGGQIEPGAPVAIIDYDLPSSSKRLWLVDPDDPGLALNEWVTHGSGSGNLVAEAFSNTQDSHQTSLGVFRGAEVYQGKYGASLRLDGLEPGFNDAARDRAIVVHAAWYAEPEIIERTGRLGRSQGCPAVRPEVMPQVRKALAEGGMLFAHASNEQWLARSRFLDCG